MKFEIEEMDMEEDEEEIDKVGEIKGSEQEDNDKNIPIFDDVKSETEDSIYSEEGSTALLEADGLTPEEEGFMKGYLDE